MRALFVSAVFIMWLSGCSQDVETNTEEVNKRIALLETQVSKLKSQQLDIKSNLGPWQFINNDPALVTNITRNTFGDANNTSSVIVEYEAMVQQTNQNFPLANYNFEIYFEVVDAQGKRFYAFSRAGRMKVGKVTLVGTEVLYGVREKNKRYKLIARRFSWHPIILKKTKNVEN